MRISDWSSDVCSSDLVVNSAVVSPDAGGRLNIEFMAAHHDFHEALVSACDNRWLLKMRDTCNLQAERYRQLCVPRGPRSEEHTSELQSLMRISYAVFCLKKKKKYKHKKSKENNVNI